MGLFTSLWLTGTALALIIILPFYMTYITLKHFIVGPSHPAWGWFTELSCSCGRLYFSMISAPDTPLVPPKEPTMKGRKPVPAWPSSSWRQRKITYWLMGKGTRVDSVHIEPAPESWIVGVAAHASNVVQAVEGPGFWVSRQDDGPPVGRAFEGQKVILYWPGDGTHPLTSPVSYGLAQTTGLRVFAGSYRAVTSNSNAFPAQMLDLLSAYAYVIDQGFSPANILIVAESAGAFFCLAMMRHLSELRGEHSIDAGMPGAVLLMSPACNMSRFDHPSVETDWRLPHYRRRTVPSLARHFDLNSLENSLYFSPALAKPGAFNHLASTRVWVQFGSGELFADDIRKLIAAMRTDGVDVIADEVWGGLHTDATVRRSFGSSGGSWARMIAAVENFGWARAGGERTLSGVVV